MRSPSLDFVGNFFQRAFSNRNLHGGSISTFKQSLSDDGIFKWCYQQPPDPLISITLPFIKVKIELRRRTSKSKKKAKGMFKEKLIELSYINIFNFKVEIDLWYAAKKYPPPPIWKHGVKMINTFIRKKWGSFLEDYRKSMY